MKQQADILVVDDTVANLHLLCKMLKEQGHRTRPVPSGELALQAARTAPPDLILLDISMPGMSGFEVCEQLKQSPNLREIPVIFISAHTETIDKVKAFSMGGVDYVTKPFQFEEVRARVEVHLSLQEQKRALRDSYKKLSELERLRDNLVHMLIHDLRSPLSTISALLEILYLDNQKSFSTESLHDIQDARDACQNMIEMVSAILDVNKMEAKQLTPQRQEIDLVALSREVLLRLRALVQSRRLRVDSNEEVASLLADRKLIERVLQNLFTNALKFTPGHGSISIQIEVRPERVKLSLTDTGQGIPPEFHQKIFEKFGQVEARAKGSVAPSTGLGLAFCKLAIEAHGGEIGVESTVGVGSTFWFTLPRGTA